MNSYENEASTAQDEDQSSGQVYAIPNARRKKRVLFRYDSGIRRNVDKSLVRLIIKKSPSLLEKDRDKFLERYGAEPLESLRQCFDSLHLETRQNVKKDYAKIIDEFLKVDICCELMLKVIEGRLLKRDCHKNLKRDNKKVYDATLLDYLYHLKRILGAEFSI